LVTDGLGGKNRDFSFEIRNKTNNVYRKMPSTQYLVPKDDVKQLLTDCATEAAETGIQGV